MKPVRRILVATDFSAASRPAFRQAVAWAAESGAALWIAHVAAPPPPLSADGYVLPRFYEDITLAIQTDAEKKLRLLRGEARKSGVSARLLLLRGSPHEALNRAARRHRADLMILGTHGRTGLKRLLVGSVAARVVATAVCPVLTVRGR